jgi:hypothetical protein
VSIAIDTTLASIYDKKELGSRFGMHGRFCMFGVLVFAMLPLVIDVLLATGGVGGRGNDGGEDRSWRITLLLAGGGHALSGSALLIAHRMRWFAILERSSTLHDEDESPPKHKMNRMRMKKPSEIMTGHDLGDNADLESGARRHRHATSIVGIIVAIEFWHHMPRAAYEFLLLVFADLFQGRSRFIGPLLFSVFILCNSAGIIGSGRFADRRTRHLENCSDESIRARIWISIVSCSVCVIACTIQMAISLPNDNDGELLEGLGAQLVLGASYLLVGVFIGMVSSVCSLPLIGILLHGDEELLSRTCANNYAWGALGRACGYLVVPASDALAQLAAGNCSDGLYCARSDKAIATSVFGWCLGTMLVSLLLTVAMLFAVRRPIRNEALAEGGGEGNAAVELGLTISPIHNVQI